MKIKIPIFALVCAGLSLAVFAQDKAVTNPAALPADPQLKLEYNKAQTKQKEANPAMKPDIQILTYPKAAKKDFEWGNLTWFAGRSLGNSTEMTIGRCILKPGQSNPRHYHPNCTEILVVMQGNIEHTGPNGEKVKMSVGDTVTIPPNTWHQASNIGDSEAVLFIAFSSADRETIGE